jgi:NAD(P)-dependent dehydrogenase (short-subunit alcohol dehydrogenase family)
MSTVERPIALVTGASRGIGLEVCRQLAVQGMTVLIGARDQAKATEAANSLAGEGLDVRPVLIDVNDEQSVQRLANDITADYGRLDLLVNNAAAFADWGEMVSGADLAAVRNVFETNLFGPWRTIQALLPLLRESSHPRIVNVSSGAGSHGDEQFGLTTGGGSTASYGISKAALNALTSKLAAELAATPIIVNAVCPGFTATSPGMEQMGARPVSEGAASVVWAATLPDDGPRGGFFRDGKPLPW